MNGVLNGLLIPSGILTGRLWGVGDQMSAAIATVVTVGLIAVTVADNIRIEWARRGRR